MQIAIIEQGNKRAQAVMHLLGGEHIGEKPSPVLKTKGGEPAQMNIYLLEPMLGQKEKHEQAVFP
jgi:hypothetical protein